MKMIRDDENDPGADGALDPFFAAARAMRPDPSDDLMARIMADARAEMPVVRAWLRPDAPVGGRAGEWFRAQVLAVFGGWSGVGGLVTATLVGVWIGFATPGPLTALQQDFLSGGSRTSSSVDVVELMPEFDDFLTEG